MVVRRVVALAATRAACTDADRQASTGPDRHIGLLLTYLVTH